MQSKGWDRGVFSFFWKDWNGNSNEIWSNSSTMIISSNYVYKNGPEVLRSSQVSSEYSKAFNNNLT